MSGVEVERVTKKYGTATVLKEIYLKVTKGEFVVLLGPSGCGKSTLLNIIAGLENLESGAVFIGGKDVTDLEPADRGLAMVFQSYALFPTMTVRGNLSFGLKVQKTPRDEIEKRIASVAQLLQIEALLDRKPSELSGGQRQRIAIGRALVRRSDVWLFDEPLSNLDAKLRAETRVELKKLHIDMRPTIIYVTHDQIEALTMADRVAVMHAGRIEQYDKPQTIYDSPATLFVAGFVGSPSMNFIEGKLDIEGRFLATGASRPISLFPDGGSADFTENDSVVLGVRPEELYPIDNIDPQGRSLPAKTIMSESMGPDTLIWVEVYGKRWSMRIPTSKSTGMPDVFEMGFDAMRASLFDKETGVRLN
ncbi:ABC transporter ATP-binding protein [Mesorhizobium sp. 10J20-29]